MEKIQISHDPEIGIRNQIIGQRQVVGQHFDLDKEKQIETKKNKWMNYLQLLEVYFSFEFILNPYNP